MHSVVERDQWTNFNQVEDWSLELMEVEHRAKAAARALLFVLDNETRAVAASVEVAHLAAMPRDLLLVLRPYQRHQAIGREPISDQEYVELSRARATLQEAVERRGLPAFTDIPSALRCAGAVLRGARTHPRHQLGHTILRLKRTFDAAGGRAARLARARALDALQEVTSAPRHLIERCLPPANDTVDFEAFCAAVVELATDQGWFLFILYLLQQQSIELLINEQDCHKTIEYKRRWNVITYCRKS
ncbi:hypothetical protein EVAR_48188_1 [Eumeta japonica]|uniref:Uncharacterized protein n=1 Tax=Eumeta variegata TaxID=151549 RepID=A0A4C1XSB7_EUMVA|nr:hypothetical protein EVAR_48188_1 [Eumeta japonica]